MSLNTLFQRAIISQEEIDEREREYIKKYNSLSPNGYNFDTGGSNGREWSEVSRLKKSKTYILKHRDGEVMTITNARRFCQENKINIGDFGRMIKGKQIFAGDYCLPETDMRITRRSVGIIRVKDKNGKVYEVFNMTRFARENNLNSSSFIAMCRGRYRTCEGWSLEPTIIRHHGPRNKIWDKLTLIKHGQEFEVENAHAFSREHGFESSLLSALVSGKIFSIRDFRLKTIIMKDGTTKTFDDNPHYGTNRKYIDIVVRLRNGNLIKVDNQDEFCRCLGIDASSFIDALKGKTKNPRKYEIMNCRINPDYRSNETILERHSL